MENDYNVCADRDNSIIFKIKKLSKFQTYYFGFLLIILLLPFAGFLVLFIKFELLKSIVYCSNQQSTEQQTALPSLRAERVGSSSGLAVEGKEEDILNQQSNTNEQSVIIRGNSYPFDGSSTEVGGEASNLSNGSIGSNGSQVLEGVNKGEKVKINSNVQSNVNKQLQPPLSSNEIHFKNKQQNINIQVYNGHKQLEKHYTYTSPPQYNARSFNSQNTGS